MKNVNPLISTFKTILFLALVLVFSNSSNLRNKISTSITQVNTACEARYIQMDYWSDNLLSSCPNGKTAIFNRKSNTYFGSGTTKYATVFCC